MNEQNFSIIQVENGFPVCIGGGIHKALAAIAGEVSAVGKTGYNQQQGFKYRPVDEFMNALNPIMSKHGVSVRPYKVEETLTERVATVNSQGKASSKMCIGRRITFLFTHEDGSFAFAQTEGYGEDSGDKATNKAMAFAFKYLLIQSFVVPTQELKDPDGETPEPTAAPRQQAPAAGKAPGNGQKPAEAPKASKPLTSADLAAKKNDTVTFFLKGYTVDDFVKSMTKKGFVISDAVRAEVLAIYNEVQTTLTGEATDQTDKPAEEVPAGKD